MTTPRSCRFPPTPQLSARKRELFPSPLNRRTLFGSILSEISNTPRRSNRIAKNGTSTPSSSKTDTTLLYLSDNSSDLGHMSPLELSSSPDRYDSSYHNSPNLDSPSVLLARPRFFNQKGVANNYQYAEYNSLSTKTDEQEMPLVDPETPRKSFSGIFVRQNPIHDKENIQVQRKSNTIDIESLLESDTVIPETPEKLSPTAQLRTPHEILSDNIELPKLHHRKALAETEGSITGKIRQLKRHLSNNCFDVCNKVAKLDESSKARTSLFSVKSFYSQTTKMDSNKNFISGYSKNNIKLESKKRSSIRKKPSKKKGQINMGVMHKIRKPKPKNLKQTTTALLKAALNIDQDVLNTSFASTMNSEIVLNGAQRLNSSFSSCIEKKPVKEFSISLAITENDNSNEENEQNKPQRKFFKSKRILDNKQVKLQDNLIINIKSKTSDENSNRNISVHSSDFKDSDGDMTKEQDMVQKLLSEWNESESDDSLKSSQSFTERCELLGQKVDLGPLSPTSELSSMTSVLALDCPTVSSAPSNENNLNNNKLYPIFYKGYVSDKIDAYENISKPTFNKKMWKPSISGQYQLDAGQKKIGLQYCSECDFVYQHADPDEELFHHNYHNSLHILNFQGWKNESVISVLVNVGRVIHIKSNSPKSWHKRIEKVMEIVDNELGIIPEPYEPQESTQVFMMANSKQIVGILLAQSIFKAHRMISSIDSFDLCTEEAFDAKCGVCKLWIAPPFRRKGFATHLINAMRCNFVFGKVLDLDEIAFSTPTAIGISFAKKICKRDDFLVYQEF